MTHEGPVDVVFTFGFETWEDSVCRGSFSPDVLAAGLLESDLVGRLIVADRPRGALGALRRRFRSGRPRFPGDARRSLISPVRLARRDPIDPSKVRRMYSHYVARLSSEATRRGLMAPVLLTTHPFVAAAARGDAWHHVTYYGYDDWAAHPAYAPWHHAFTDAYRAISLSGHRVVAVSRSILDRIGSPGASTVVPNGVFPDEWISPVPAPSWFHALPEPRLLYAGTLDTRLDVSWIQALAGEFRGASIVLVGTVGDAAALRPLRDLTNVHIHEWVPREAIRGVTFAADVALIPHVSSDLTRAMSPLKLYEYLSAGRPVVASDLEPIREVADARRATSADEFVEQVRAALLEGPAREPDRLAFIAANSWEARLDHLLPAALGRDRQS